MNRIHRRSNQSGLLICGFMLLLCAALAGAASDNLPAHNLLELAPPRTFAVVAYGGPDLPKALLQTDKNENLRFGREQWSWFVGLKDSDRTDLWVSSIWKHDAPPEKIKQMLSAAGSRWTPPTEEVEDLVDMQVYFLDLKGIRVKAAILDEHTFVLGTSPESLARVVAACREELPRRERFKHGLSDELNKLLKPHGGTGLALAVAPPEELLDKLNQEGHLPELFTGLTGASAGMEARSEQLRTRCILRFQEPQQARVMAEIVESYLQKLKPTDDTHTGPSSSESTPAIPAHVKVLLDSVEVSAEQNRAVVPFAAPISEVRKALPIEKLAALVREDTFKPKGGGDRRERD